MFHTKVEKLLTNALSERTDLFLIELRITPDNSIKVIIDGDHGVTLEDCILVSRAIEHNLDREEHDFSLEVTSAGANLPLSHQRQYPKNLNRTLDLKTSNKQFQGKLIAADSKEIVLEWRSREPKPIGKGKTTVTKQARIAYEDIVEAKVMIKF